ncbi:MAG TPA: pyridoxal-phosphate dependent enzyme [Pseudonocardiaceae bacterium]|jgi:1-aminocyclopropane-1-carboxylate deaminase|nr:pyridoxal-phosphate dependent enzyme [Pseudonocardiaceae bacterium]
MEYRGVRIVLRREDLVNPDLPGNKWRKLKYNLEAAREQRASTLLTFGGAFSNHIRATAAAGRIYGFRTVGVIRGEARPLNESLARAVRDGMQLAYLDRNTYRDKTHPAVLAQLRHRFGDFYLLPEGGSNALAVKGCREIVAEIDVEFDVICCPVGTGGTLAGIASALPPGTRALGFSALRGGAEFLPPEVRRLQGDQVTDNWTITDDYVFGGFARRKPELDSFIVRFRKAHGLELEWVYVAKMMYGIHALIDNGTFAAGSTVVAVITG